MLGFVTPFTKFVTVLIRKKNKKGRYREMVWFWNIEHQHMCKHDDEATSSSFSPMWYAMKGQK